MSASGLAILLGANPYSPIILATSSSDLRVIGIDRVPALPIEPSGHTITDEWLPILELIRDITVRYLRHGATFLLVIDYTTILADFQQSVKSLFKLSRPFG